MALWPDRADLYGADLYGDQRAHLAVEERTNIMQINYDPEADAIYIRLREGDVSNTLQISTYIYADVDENDVPLGLEILFASRVMASPELTNISFNISHAAAASHPVAA